MLDLNLVDGKSSQIMRYQRKRLMLAPVSRESPGEHRNIARRGLQSPFELKPNLVLKVLSSNQWVEVVGPSATERAENFSADSADILVVVETFPKDKER